MYRILSIFVALSFLPVFVALGASEVVDYDTHGSLVFDAAGNLAVGANDLAVSRFTYDDHRVEAAVSVTNADECEVRQ